MSNPYSQKTVGFASMFFNAEPRVACQLAIDASGSMEGPKIAALNRGVAEFLSAIRADSLAAKRVEVGIVTFGGKVDVVQAFADVTSITPPTIVADGDTPMGAAIVESFRLVAERQALYRQAQLPSYAPWYVLITDGESTDDLSAAKKLIEAAEKANKGIFYAIGVEGADMAELKALSVRPPLELDGLAFGDLFKWLSQSLSVASKSPGAKPPAKPAAHLEKGQAKSAEGRAMMRNSPKAVAITAAGTSHQTRGIGCQDAVAVKQVGPLTLAALADGAGSAAAAERGAGLAVFSALYHLQRALQKHRIGKSPCPKAMLRSVLREVRIDLKRCAKKSGLRLHDLAATLLVAITNRDTGDIHTLHIGDGAVVAGPPWRLVSAPQQGPSREYTRFVTDPDAERRAVISSTSGAGAQTVVLFSDGLQDLIVQGDAVSAPFFDWCHTTIAAPDPEADIAALFASPDVRSRTSDDLSLALVRAMP